MRKIYSVISLICFVSIFFVGCSTDETTADGSDPSNFLTQTLSQTEEMTESGEPINEAETTQTAPHSREAKTAAKTVAETAKDTAVTTPKTTQAITKAKSSAPKATNTAKPAEETVCIGKTTGDKELDNEIKKILDKNLKPSDSMDKKIKFACDWYTNVKYVDGLTHDKYDDVTKDNVVYYAKHAILNRKGNCKYRAAAQKVLLDRLGYETTVINGEIDSPKGNGWVSHCWVISKINGKYRMFDPSMTTYWKNTKPKAKRDFYMQTEEYYTIDHRWDIDAYPKAV